MLTRQPITDDLLKTKNKGKSELFIKPSKGDLSELKNSVKKFVYSILDMNTYEIREIPGRIIIFFFPVPNLQI